MSVQHQAYWVNVKGEAWNAGHQLEVVKETGCAEGATAPSYYVSVKSLSEQIALSYSWLSRHLNGKKVKLQGVDNRKKNFLALTHCKELISENELFFDDEDNEDKQIVIGQLETFIHEQTRDPVFVAVAKEPEIGWCAWLGSKIKNLLW